jgi:caffeoyl-CoA O-methyltransferase
MTRSFTLTEDLHSYLVAHTTPLDDIARDLVEETRVVAAERVVWQIAPEQAAFLTLLAQLTGARRAVEVGTFTGMSSLSIARGMPADGHLTCLDISAEYTAVARRYWERAGVADRIELRLGPAAEGLRELPIDPHLDLAFIDADKVSYLTYWRELVPRMRPGGLVIVDNVLWSGQVLDPAPDDTMGKAIVKFNDAVMADDRVDLVMLPIGDGLTLARRR